mgnify:CR=1 FL=1
MIKIDAVGFVSNEDKWFPILFKDAPIKGIPLTPRRLKSVGQHLTGYASREDALKAVKEDGLLKDVAIIDGDIPHSDTPEKIILVTSDLKLTST